jgi:hypothetical protein
MQLKDAGQKFVDLPIRPHLAWLYELKGSQVFPGIWKAKCGVGAEDAKAVKKQQKDVVASVIPQAKQAWDRLSKSFETGKAILEEIRWCVDMPWIEVQTELHLLERTAPKDGTWTERAIQQTEAMRLASKLKVWAPAMLKLRNEVLPSLFVDSADDECVREMQQVVSTHEAMWQMTLHEMIDLVKPFEKSIKTISKDMVEYVILAVKDGRAVERLLQYDDLDNFNRLLALVRPNTDNNVVLTALAAFQHTRTFLSSTLYGRKYNTLREFLQQLSTLTVDENTTNYMVKSRLITSL